MDTIPWFGWSPATMNFFEENLAGPVAQPANAWTSLAYCAVALYLLFRYREDAGTPVRLLIPIAALVGVTSALYHASYAFFFQVFDLGSMYLLTSFLLASNARRWYVSGGKGDGALSGRTRVASGLTAVSSVYPSGTGAGGRIYVAVFLGVFTFSLAVLLGIRGKVGALLFALEVVAVIGSETILSRSARSGPATGSPDYRPWLIAVALLAAAFGVWILDIRRLIFSADSHVLNGHGLWHIVNSFCFVFLYRFYRKAPPVRSSDPGRRSAA